MTERYVLLGLAPARTEWFRRVAAWAADVSLPAEFVRCISVEEALLRLEGARPFSALLVDAGTPGLDRDLLARAAAADCAAVVVGDPGDQQRWRDLGAIAVLARDLTRAHLLEVLADVAERVAGTRVDIPSVFPRPEGPLGRMVAVTGPGGTGASVVAVALAQGLAAEPGRTRRSWRSPADAREGRGLDVLLADLCRVADQALYHDAAQLVPGLQELIDLHRMTRPDRDEVLAQTFEVPARGYRLVLGLRRSRHWVGLREASIAAALDSLQWLADIVIADVDPDVEGERETGSHDVQERHGLTRAAVRRADLVLVVGDGSMKGTAALVRTLAALVDVGVEPEQLVPVANRSPRSPRRRAQTTATVSQLLQAATGMDADRFQPVLHLPDQDPEAALRDGVALPTALPRAVSHAVLALLERTQPTLAPPLPTPVPIVPGSLSGFTAQEPPS